jgi:hypothetical protein
MEVLSIESLYIQNYDFIQVLKNIKAATIFVVNAPLPYRK